MAQPGGDDERDQQDLPDVGDNLPPEPLTETIQFTEAEPLPFEWRDKEHKAKTASHLAYGLLIILGGGFAIHYLTTAILAFHAKDEALKTVSTVFTGWLPAITGLVGSAVTYYFTRDDD